MGKAYKTLAVYPERCNGCGDCEVACAKVKAQSNDIAHSRIKINRNAKDQLFWPVVCLQCGDPDCVRSCPSRALSKNPDNGIVFGDRNRCVTCTLCTLGCSYAGITYNPVIEKVMKCDLCGGDPECVKVCKPKALEYQTVATVFNEQKDFEDLFAPGQSECLGCNLEILVRHALRHIGPDTVLAAPPGCLPGTGCVGFNGFTGTKVPSIHPLLTNTASMLAGLRRYYKRIGRDVTALALAGDGGAADVGFQSLSGAAERGEEILFVCIDNEGYMNTGVQRSGTTPYGSWTSTTPVGPSLRGKTRDQKYMPLVMLMHNTEYVGTAATAFIEDFHAKLEKAHQASKRGFAYLHVFTPCPTGWRYPGDKSIEVQRKAVATNMFPLWEYERTTGELHFTHPVDNPLPLEEYLSMLGKFRHLEDDQIQHLKETVATRVEILKAIARAKKVAEPVELASAASF